MSTNFENNSTTLSMNKCTVGLFNLPGISFDKKEISDDLYEQMAKWSEENNCGTPLKTNLWSFRSEAKREWFILRWAGTEISQ